MKLWLRGQLLPRGKAGEDVNGHRRHLKSGGGSWDSVSPYLAGGVQSGKARAAGRLPGAQISRLLRCFDPSLH